MVTNGTMFVKSKIHQLPLQNTLLLIWIFNIFRIPVIAETVAKNLKIGERPRDDDAGDSDYNVSCNSSSSTYDPSVCLPSASYCQLLDFLLQKTCLESSILELWGYNNEQLYENLTYESVLERINQPNLISVPFQNQMDLSKILKPDTGLIRKNNRGYRCLTHMDWKSQSHRHSRSDDKWIRKSHQQNCTWIWRKNARSHRIVQRTILEHQCQKWSSYQCCKQFW